MVNCLIESIEPLNVLCTCVLQFPICQDAKADITVDLNYLDPKVHIDLSMFYKTLENAVVDEN